MVQEKKKGMEDTSEKKGRMTGRDEQDRSTANKPASKTPSMPSKNDSSSSRKSR